MSNPSLKEQLMAVASQMTEKKDPVKKAAPNKPKPPAARPKAHTPKPAWLEQALYGIELLKAHFPRCFTDASLVKPLKKGIKQDLVKFLSTLDTIVTEDKACMVKSLTYYVNTVAYHKRVVEGAMRIDLEGNPSGVVSTEEAQYSIERQRVKREAKPTAIPNMQSKAREVTTE